HRAHAAAASSSPFGSGSPRNAAPNSASAHADKRQPPSTRSTRPRASQSVRISSSSSAVMKRQLPFLPKTKARFSTPLQKNARSSVQKIYAQYRRLVALGRGNTLLNTYA